MSTAEYARRLASLVAELHVDADEDRTVAQILAQTLAVVPAAQAASLTVRAGRGRWVTLGSTSEPARRLDARQHELAEGPARDAAGGAEWVRSDDVGTDARWRAWGAEAAAAGVRSVLSVRLTAGGGGIGVLTVYAEAPGAFADEGTVDLAVLYATLAARALDSARLVAGLSTALSSRHRIGMAQGVLMERFDLDEDRAFGLLRRLSMTHNVKLHTLADELVSTGRLSVLDVAEAGPGTAPEPGAEA